MTSFSPAPISGAWIVEGVRHQDSRGWFQELFKQSTVRDATSIDFVPVQLNVSHSVRGVIRGIHYSVAPQGQAKYVSVLDGEVDDYIIDVRRGSPTFGQWTRVRLTADEGKSVLLGSNLAHAFEVISDRATVCYGVTAEFNPAVELAINPFCSTLSIDWRIKDSTQISDKDRSAPDTSDQDRAGNLPLF